MKIINHATNHLYRDGWDRIFGKKIVQYSVDFECDICNKKYPSTDYFPWGIAQVPTSLASDIKNNEYILRCAHIENGKTVFLCSPRVHKICDVPDCKKEATHKYLYSATFAMEDKNGSRPVSLLCSPHSIIFSRFAGSIGQLTKD